MHVKIQDGGGRHFEISLTAITQPFFEQIRTKFDTEIENGVPLLVLLAKLISRKIQDGGIHHIDKKLSYRRETARQLHTTTWAGQLTF